MYKSQTDKEIQKFEQFWPSIFGPSLKLCWASNCTCMESCIYASAVQSSINPENKFILFWGTAENWVKFIIFLHYFAVLSLITVDNFWMHKINSNDSSKTKLFSYFYGPKFGIWSQLKKEFETNLECDWHHHKMI